jgi:hypothetical protein
MMNSDLSVHHKNNNLKVVVAFANFLGFPVVEEYQCGNLTMVLYGRKKKLIDMCEAFKRYEMEDFALIDKFFSKESVRDLIFLHWSS